MSQSEKKLRDGRDVKILFPKYYILWNHFKANKMDAP